MGYFATLTFILKLDFNQTHDCEEIVLQLYVQFYIYILFLSSINKE